MFEQEKRTFKHHAEKTEVPTIEGGKELSPEERGGGGAEAVTSVFLLQ